MEWDENEWGELKLLYWNLLRSLRMAHPWMHAYPPFILWDRDERAEAGPATP